MQELAVVLGALGVDLQDIQLHSALAISADGRTIVGTRFQDDFFDPNDPFGTPGLGNLLWVATIPEPSTAMLVGPLSDIRRSTLRARDEC